LKKSYQKISPSLIIATYNWPEALELVLKSALEQSIKPFEILIADDGSKKDTKELIEDYRRKTGIPIRHIWHEDKGFRLAEIRNKAIKAAKGNYIIQVDGDTILHKDFVKDHIKYAKKGQFISGSRVLLNQKFSEKILKTKDFNFSVFTRDARNKHYHLRLPLLTGIFLKPSQDINKVIKTVRGCNMSFWKEDLLAVNGYNQDLTGWGREDSELSARLVNMGLYKVNLKFAAVQYHIYHRESSQINLSLNENILQETIRNKKIAIENGIEKIKNPPRFPKNYITAIIPVYNEEKNISEAISQVLWADEIIIIDSYSTDKTLEIASRFEKPKIIQRKFDNFSSQKNYAIKQAKNDWVFILDADERLSPGLKNEIINKSNNPGDYKAFWIKRVNFFQKKKIRFSGWQNDRVLRLFNRNYCQYNGKFVHEEISCNNKTGVLKNPLLHYTYDTYEQYKNKMFLYSQIKARELSKKNIRPNFFHKYIKPAYRFFYHYIFKLGFLDGKAGYIIAKVNARGLYKRYKILEKLNRQNNTT